MIDLRNNTEAYSRKLMTCYQGKLQPEGILEQWLGSMVRVVLVLGYAVHKISQWSWQANKNG